jgi:hypothetical protein
MRSLVLPSLLLLAAACGPAAAPSPRAVVPGVDPVSGALGAVEAELPGCELAQVRGPAGSFSLGGLVEDGRIQTSGLPPDCSFRRAASGAFAPSSLRCASLLGAYATLERARAFLVAAGGESLPPAAVVAEPRSPASDPVAPGQRYLPASDAFVLQASLPGARVPAGQNQGLAARELGRRQLRALLETHRDEAEGLALFLGAAASGDPGYLAASEPGGDPRGELDLSRPLPADAPASSVVAGALWAWAEVTADPTFAARAALAAAHALGGGRDGAQPLLSLVAEQLEGAERDQACAVFRARAGRLPACP